MVKMGDIWDRAVEFLGDNVAVLLPIVLLAIFVPTSISNSLEELQPTASADLRLVLGVVTLGFTILSLWAQLAIAALAIDPAVRTGAARSATARLLPAVGIYLLLLVAVGVMLVPLVATMAAAGVDFAAMGSGRPPATTIAPGWGFAILALTLATAGVLLWAVARLLPLTGTIVAERRGVGAIAHAFRLTRGLGWKLVGVLLLYIVVTLVSMLAAQTVFGSVLRLVAGGGEGPVTIAGVITAVVVAVVQTGFTVLAAAYCAKLYVALRHQPASAPPAPTRDPIAT